MRGNVLQSELNGLLTTYAPTIIVVRRRSRVAATAAATVKCITSTVRKEARKRSIQFESIASRDVYVFFRQYGCRTKHEIASTLAEWFEELRWKLPTMRKPWQNEHSAMVVFDALSTAMTVRGTQ
jgi:hypothetical protein